MAFLDWLFGQDAYMGLRGLYFLSLSKVDLRSRLRYQNCFLQGALYLDRTLIYIKDDMNAIYLLNVCCIL